MKADPKQATFFRTDEAAKYLRLGVSTLEKYRMTGGGPKYSNLGRAIIYSREDLNAWVEAHKV